MIETRHQQRRLAEGLFAQEVESWTEAWMEKADQVLEDERLVDLVYEALGRRCPKSRTRGRKGTPAEVVLRLMVLKHMRDWSYEILEREVRANLVYRRFTRIGGEKVPDEKTMGRLGRALGPEVVRRIQERLVVIAQKQKLVRGRKLRMDTTVVETNIHYPTDSSLLGDGVRALTRTMKKITAVAGEAGTRLRNRMRSVAHRVIEIAQGSRSQGAAGEQKRQRAYRRLLSATRKVVNQAVRFSQEIAAAVKRAVNPKGQAVLEAAKRDLDTLVPRVKQVIRQARARVLCGLKHVPDKIVSLFEPTTEIIRKGKASKPTEFGKLVKIQEAENQIITDYEVYPERPSDSHLLVPALEAHQRQLGRVPACVAADAGFYSAENERQAQQMGVRWVSIPNRSTRSAERRPYQKQRWFRKGQKWRTGSEGRISLLKRRHGLDRCRYRGFAGMQRWVGLGVIADMLINMGRILAYRDTS